MMPDQSNLAVYLLLGLSAVVGTVGAWFGKSILIPMRDAHLDLVRCLKDWLMASGKDIGELKTSVASIQKSHEILLDSHEELSSRINCPEARPRGTKSTHA